METMDTLDMVVEGLLIPLVASLGLLGNIASVVVLSNASIDMKISFCRILTMLAIFDSIFIISLTVIFSLPELSSYYSSSIHPYVFPWLLPISQMSLNGSTWSTVSVAVERFISVVVPNYKLARAPIIFFILPVVILSVVWPIPRFFELYTCFVEVNNSVINNNKIIIETVNITKVCATDLRKDPTYVRDYINIANFVGMAFIPFLFLCVLNGCIYKTIKETSIKSLRPGSIRSTCRLRRDKRIAMLLITVVIVFLICNIPKITVNFYEVFHLTMYKDVSIHWPAWIQILTRASHFLLVLNSSINIFIYCWKDDKFRVVLFKMLKIQRPMTPNDQESPTLFTSLMSVSRPKRRFKVKRKIAINVNMMVEELDEIADDELTEDGVSNIVFEHNYDNEMLEYRTEYKSTCV